MLQGRVYVLQLVLPRAAASVKAAATPFCSRCAAPRQRCYCGEASLAWEFKCTYALKISDLELIVLPLRGALWGIERNPTGYSLIAPKLRLKYLQRRLHSTVNYSSVFCRYLCCLPQAPQRLQPCVSAAPAVEGRFRLGMYVRLLRESPRVTAATTAAAVASKRGGAGSAS